MYDNKKNSKNKKDFSDSEVRGERSGRVVSVDKKDKWTEK